MLSEMDSVSVRSLSVPRVAARILQLVPQARLEDGTYRQVLTAVRMWAHARAVYCNKVGLLGGVNWAILVGFVAQLFPEATSARLLQRFFEVMSNWPWPQPIMLCQQYTPTSATKAAVTNAGDPKKKNIHEQWSPLSVLGTNNSIMPILSPGY